MKVFFHLGQYLILMKQVFKKPDKFSVFHRNTIREADSLGIESLWIVAIISLFMGGVATIQMAFNIDTPLIPQYTIGFGARQTIVMELSPTIISLILAGKVGSRIASEIGTMRITEQIDAMEIMGVNSAGYLILPKIAAIVIINPILMVISIALSLFGGWIIGTTTGLITSYDYVYGIQMDFRIYDIVYALTKTAVFAFLIASVSGYYGYYSEGGATGVGKSSTNAVVQASILIILFNLILTQLMLSD